MSVDEVDAADCGDCEIVLEQAQGAGRDLGIVEVWIAQRWMPAAVRRSRKRSSAGTSGGMTRYVFGFDENIWSAVQPRRCA
jgi:hypothetical protein